MPDCALESRGQRESVPMVAEGHELVELPECFFWDSLPLLVCVSADRREHADRVRPREDGAAKAVHGVRESALPYEGSIMRVDHREVSVEVVDCVPDEGARFHAGHLSRADRVEDDESFHEPLVW